ncbi:MAG: DUF1801 domain-containing protein [Flavobacteriales bacterium]
MKTNIKSDPAVNEVFDNYPIEVKDKMLRLRQLVIASAKELDEVSEVEETLKWSEPSYVTKFGSTIRMNWKEKAPDQYAIYFKCTSRLVPTFKTVFKDLFEYEGTRAIVFKLDDMVPDEALKECIKAGLRYHKVKTLPLLGM